MSKANWLRVVLLSCCLASETGLGAGIQQASQAPSAADTSHPAQSQQTSGEFDEARRLLQQGRYDDAIGALHQVETTHPSMKGLSHELGAAYYKKSDYVNAIASLKKALEENPGDSEAEQLLGLSYYLSGRPAEAIPALEKVQTWYPSANVDASYILGICYIQTKDYPNARKAFAKMFDVSAESAASYLFTARMLLRQDFGPVAEEYAHKAVALDPKLPLAHELLGELNLYHSQIDQAIAEFRKELEINPGYAAAYYKLADCYSRVQKFDEAERLLQRSIWLDPTSTGPYILLGKVLEKKGETQLAVRALQRALEMDPNNPIPHHLLGEAYRDLGKSEDADRELKVAAQLEERQNAKP
ncbi:MAG: tetratricopeptide repeat protein [Candidatus Acidiferrum sp.]